MDPRIRLLNRLRVQLSSYVYVGDRQRDVWRGPQPHYAFRCPIHGLVESYPHGYDGRLECPRCLEERAAAKVAA